MIPAESHAFAPQVRVSARNDYQLAHDLGDERWPVWLRLVTIIGLSSGLWGAIIWAAMTAFR